LLVPKLRHHIAFGHFQENICACVGLRGDLGMDGVRTGSRDRCRDDKGRLGWYKVALLPWRWIMKTRWFLDSIRQTLFPRRGEHSFSRRPFTLSLESLEDRLVPTIVFQPQFGPETVLATSGPERFSNNPVHLIFWGSQWHGDTSPAARTIKDAANRVLTSTYLSGLAEYGSSGGAFLDISTFDNNDPASSNPGKFTPQALDAIVSNATHNSLPRADTGDTGSNRRIYVVITPPGYTASGGGSGYNSSFPDPFHLLFTTHYVQTPVIWCSTAGDINNFSGPNLDYFTSVFSHEMAEIQTDPYGNGLHVALGTSWHGGGDNQIGDGEPAGITYGYRLNGALVQPYWSAGFQAFIVPDGRSNQMIQLRASWTPEIRLLFGIVIPAQFQGSYTLHITEFISHLTMDQSPAGGVQVELNDEIAQFEPGQITHVTVATLGSRDILDIEQALPEAPIDINLGSGDDTVLVGQFAHRLDNVRGSVSIHGGRGMDTLRLDDSRSLTFPATYTITAGSLSREGIVLAGIFHAPVSVKESISYSSIATIELDGGQGVNTYNVRGTAAGSSVTIKSGSGTNTTLIGDTNHTLDGINGTVQVQGGTADMLVLDDSQAFHPLGITYTLTADHVTRVGRDILVSWQATIGYRNISNIALNGGLGFNSYHVQGTAAGTSVQIDTGTGSNNSTLIGDTNHTLDGINGTVQLQGGGIVDGLVIDDSQAFHLLGITYTLTADHVTRVGRDILASWQSAIGYRNISSIELDGSTALNTFLVASQISVPMTLVGGAGLNTLDYSSYTGNVVVDLPLQTATGIASISKIQNVKGASGGAPGSYNLLVGSGGNMLTGGTGRRNLLIAGAAASTLIAGDTEDIMIAGSTQYDSEAGMASLQAIMAYWTGPDDRDTRVANLMAGAGVPLLDPTTVQGNGGSNTLRGSGAWAMIFSDGTDTDPTDPASGLDPGSVIIPIAP
jgi:hypothetical protein